MWLAIVITALCAYLLGNHNGAVCVSVWMVHDDVRTHGSGNAGLTNFMRSYGGGKTLLVIALDVGKTVLACLLGGLLLEPYGYRSEGMMLGAVAVSLGHDFPLLLNFKGGKGILCGATAVFVIDWRLGLVLLAIFVLTVLLSRYISLGSILAAVGFGTGFALLHSDRPWVVAGGIFLAVLAIWMHRANIGRLLKGNENKFTIRKKEKNQ